MKAFVALFSALDETNKTNEKIEALVNYFKTVPAEDAVWGMYFLTGRKPKAVVQVPKLCMWAIEAAGIEPWLFDECYEAVGDVGETMALVLPPPKDASMNLPLHKTVERLYSLKRAPEDRQRQIILDTWAEMTTTERFVWNKLLTGAFRVGVSQQLVARSLAQASGIHVEVISHRLMGSWEPTAEFYQSLFSEETEDADISRPYPFSLAYALDADPETLGPVTEWSAEWKWDGIRSQLIKRNDQVFIWSRGEELITERFPELAEAANFMPNGTVMDGEILSWKDDQPDFGNLQQRIGRKVVSQKLMQEVPVIIMAYDLLEWQGEDVREQPFSWRRLTLESLLSNNFHAGKFLVSPLVTGLTWDDLKEARLQSRAKSVEGLVLKRLDSPYRVGRQRGDWWKWKIDPYTVDAVLIYAQRGTGKRASLYTDYTFGVWNEDKLVPFAKAYSGLTDAEIAQVDSFVRRNTVEKFGPVRVVKPELVFELGFEGIQKSTRHKSGIAVRFPRILRWRTDKPPAEADSLDTIKSMLEAYG
jgi:DNA ligase-1